MFRKIKRDYLYRNQFGFAKKCDTKHADKVIKILNKWCIGNCSNLVKMFVDLEKDFDGIHCKTLINILQKLEVDMRDRKLIAKL